MVVFLQLNCSDALQFRGGFFWKNAKKSLVALKLKIIYTTVSFLNAIFNEQTTGRVSGI